MNRNPELVGWHGRRTLGLDCPVPWRRAPESGSDVEARLQTVFVESVPEVRTRKPSSIQALYLRDPLLCFYCTFSEEGVGVAESTVDLAGVRFCEWVE